MKKYSKLVKIAGVAFALSAGLTLSGCRDNQPQPVEEDIVVGVEEPEDNEPEDIVEEATALRPMNIKGLLQIRFETVEEYFGNQIYFNDEEGIKYPTYYFDTGISIGVDFGFENRPIRVVTVDFSQVPHPNTFHFNGINAESTNADILLMLGEPDDIREVNEEEFSGAYMLYGYWIAENVYVKFFFDEDVNILGMEFSMILGSATRDDSEPIEQIDIAFLLLRDFEENKHLFGELIRQESGLHETYIFENGVRIGANGIIESIFVEFRRDYDNFAMFHFHGINGLSSYDDVIEIFGEEPYNIREGSDEERVGAEKSYGYWVSEEEHIYVRFFFNTNGDVVAISHFR
ncbi:MAG: hypothetical protein FWD82_07670 [Defluviitaleaceae bacterium]|nr:hypothetical protein [Defluviitaleaceae bacterium]